MRQKFAETPKRKYKIVNLVPAGFIPPLYALNLWQVHFEPQASNFLIPKNHLSHLRKSNNLCTICLMSFHFQSNISAIFFKGGTWWLMAFDEEKRFS